MDKVPCKKKRYSSTCLFYRQWKIYFYYVQLGLLNKGSVNSVDSLLKKYVDYINNPQILFEFV